MPECLLYTAGQGKAGRCEKMAFKLRVELQEAANFPAKLRPRAAHWAKGTANAESNEGKFCGFKKLGEGCCALN